jgi:uncharacterized protein YqeY
MTLKEQIGKEFNEALKARDELKLSTLRMLRAEIKKREVSGQKHELNEAEVMEAISTLVKQRRESIRLFHEGKRQDLAEKEEAELKILLVYLPQSLSPAEIESLIDQVIGETQAAGPKDQGKVMKALMPRLAGAGVDGKAVNDLVRKRLGS